MVRWMGVPLTDSGICWYCESLYVGGQRITRSQQGRSDHMKPQAKIRKFHLDEGDEYEGDASRRYKLPAIKATSKYVVAAQADRAAQRAESPGKPRSGR